MGDFYFLVFLAMHHYILIDYQYFTSYKGRLLKNLLVFLRKIEDLTFFFIDSLRTEGKKQKNFLFEPRQTPSAKIENVGVYFAKMGCKIKGGFTDIFGF